MVNRAFFLVALAFLASESFKRCAEKNSMRDYSLSFYGHLLYQLNRAQEALIILNKAIMLNPQNYFALSVLVKVEENLGFKDESLAPYNHFLEIAPRHAFERLQCPVSEV